MNTYIKTATGIYTAEPSSCCCRYLVWWYQNTTAPGILPTVTLKHSKSINQLQKNYTPVSVTVDSIDLEIEELPEIILKTYFPRTIQEQIIRERYRVQLKYYYSLAVYFDYLLKLQVPLAAPLPRKAVPLTPWMLFSRRKDDETGSDTDSHEQLFYQALNKYFLYRIMRINNTPGEIRDQLLSDPVFTGDIETVYRGISLSMRPEVPKTGSIFSGNMYRRSRIQPLTLHLFLMMTSARRFLVI